MGSPEVAVIERSKPKLTWKQRAVSLGVLTVPTVAGVFGGMHVGSDHESTHNRAQRVIANNDAGCETIFAPGQEYYSRYTFTMTAAQQDACGVGDIGADLYSGNNQLTYKHGKWELANGGGITDFSIIYSVSRDQLAYDKVAHLKDANSFDDTWPAGVGIGLGLAGLSVGYLFEAAIRVTRQSIWEATQAEQQQANTDKDAEWEKIAVATGDAPFNPNVDIAPPEPA